MPRVIGLGMLFWISGWLIQSVAFLSISRLTGSPTPELCLGVLGVELGPRRWPPRQELLVSLATIASMIVLGSFYMLMADALLDSPGDCVRSIDWSIPSLGFAGS